MKNRSDRLKAIAILLSGIAIGIALPRKSETAEKETTETRLTDDRPSHGNRPAKNKISDSVQINDHPRSLVKLKIGTKTGFSLLDGSNKLTSQAISLGKLTEGESIAIQKELDSFHQSMSELLSSNITSDPLRGNQAKGIEAYKILPFQAEAETKLLGLKKSLSDIIGEVRGSELLTTLNDPSRYSGFGSFETNLFISKAASKPDGIFADSELWQIGYEMIDPASGKTVFGGNELAASFFRKNGKIPALNHIINAD